MGEVNKNLKSMWMKGMEAIGRTASNIASNTRYKVDEMNLMNRRREILNDFGAKAYGLWLQGASFPVELEKQLAELKKVDEQLNDMRAEHFTGRTVSGEGEEESGNVDAITDDKAAIAQSVNGDEEDAADKSGIMDGEQDERQQLPEKKESADFEESDNSEIAQKPAVIFQKDDAISSVGAAIETLFEGAPSVDEMAEKMNQSLDKLDDQLKKFQGGSDQETENSKDPEKA